jgi:Fic family protein
MQSETIHPFLDGNGRIGCLLITLLLCERDILRQPPYISYYFKSIGQHYDRLMAIRNDGDWEGWIKFFAWRIRSEPRATETAAILDVRPTSDRHTERFSGSTNGLRLLDYLYQQPMISIGNAERRLKCAYATASKLIDEFQDLGILVETTGGLRNRRFRYQRYWNLFDRQVLRSPVQAGRIQPTVAQRLGAGTRKKS